MNDDDTPELPDLHGFNGRDLRGYYVFTYDGDNVIYCGSTLTDSYIAPSYPGMFSSVGMTGPTWQMNTSVCILRSPT